MDWRKAYLGGNVNPGWIPLVDELHRRVLRLDPDVKVRQVKEKFGRLCYYYALSEKALAATNDVMEPWLPSGTPAESIKILVATAESTSSWICEVCGNIGRTDTWGRGWLNTLCEEHGAIRREHDTPAWRMVAETAKS